MYKRQEYRPAGSAYLAEPCDHLYGTGAEQPGTSRLFAGAGFGERQRRSPADARLYLYAKMWIRDRDKPIEDPVSKTQVDTLAKNAEDFGPVSYTHLSIRKSYGQTASMRLFPECEVPPRV